MKFTAYVFINKHGQYFGDRSTARVKPGRFAQCLYDNFDQAMLFTSEEHALDYRSKITNTNVSRNMKLMSISIEFTKAEMFKAILTGR